MNKDTGSIVLATPQWEPLYILYDEKLYRDVIPHFGNLTKGKKLVHGTLIQVGWLIQNKNNVWFGMPMSITEQFEDLGEA